jgi:uncharacterized protein YjiS (DUF1127 family)
MFASLHTARATLAALAGTRRHPAHRGARAETPLGWMARCHATWRHRRVLAEMDDRMLSDIGLTREEALAEARRPFWDAPPRWHR